MITLRDAGAEDFSAVLALDQQSASSEQRQRFFGRVIGANQCVLALHDHAIVGYGVLEYSFFGQGFISLVYIAEPYRRRGIASLLMTHFESVCTTPKLFTSTNLSNIRMQLLLRKHFYLLSGVLQHLDENDPEMVYVKYLNGEQPRP